MAITLRGIKGTPLTQQELDVNFTEFFYSASIEGSLVKLHRFHYDSSSANPSASIDFPIDPPVGLDGYIQLKKGNSPSGSDAVHTASANFIYDYNNDVLRINGQLDVTGSSNITGDLVVGGTVTALEFKSQLVSSSIVYKSGSTKSGDTGDDIHSFTGSVNVLGDTTLLGSLSIVGVPNVRNSIDRLNTSSSIHRSEIDQLQIDSGSFSTRVTALEDFSSSLNDTYTTDVELNTSSSALTVAYTAADTALSSSASTARDVLSSSLASGITSLSSSAAVTYLKNTTDTLNGNLTVTGTITAQEFNTEYISSSVIYESGSTKFGDSIDDTHTFTGSISVLGPVDITGATDINGRLGITGFPDVSASLASAISASGTSNVTINNNANNRIITATGTDVLNGEANLTFDGSTLGVTGALTVTGDGTINGTKITKFTSSDSDITGLIGGSTTGTLVQGVNTGHFVIGMQEDGLDDSFAIIGGGGDYYSTTNYDKLIFKVSGSGQTYIGGALSVNGATDINGNLDVTGIITATNDIIAYSTSDGRLKDNVTPISNAINKINQIGGYEFDWNDNSEHSGHDVGVIAQEIEKVLPEVVATRDNGYKAVRYEKIVALLIEAVKEQQLQIEELKSKL